MKLDFRLQLNYKKNKKTSNFHLRYKQLNFSQLVLKNHNTDAGNIVVINIVIITIIEKANNGGFERGKIIMAYVPTLTRPFCSGRYRLR